METSNELFDELRRIHSQRDDKRTVYMEFSALIHRTVAQYTADFAADFTHLSARLHALCRTEKLSPRPVEVLLARSRRVLQGAVSPSATDYAYDLKAICDFIAALSHTPVPHDLCRHLPAAWRFIQPSPGHTRKRIRLTVTRWDKQYLYGTDAEAVDEQETKVCYAPQPDSAFAGLHGQLYRGAQVNLLSPELQSGTDGTPVWYPDLIILDPDFLVDITSVCSCLQSFGTSPLNHLLNKFAPAARSAAIRLGNTANQFLDDCLNAPCTAATDTVFHEEESYRRSIVQSFLDAPLDYATLPGIDASFFEQCRTQFAHISRTVRRRFSAADIDIHTTDVQLEPSFLCEALGLQGRMDLLLADLTRIVELKSGKAEEYPVMRPHVAHALQMALYKEILHYSLGMKREEVQTFLFYSRYPRFYNIRVSRSQIKTALALRNGIVHLERRLRNGEGAQLIGSLTEQHFNIQGLRSRFYEQYLRPGITEWLTTMQTADRLASAYFHTFLGFTEREQFLAKTGDTSPDSGWGFAEVWNSDAITRMQNGNLLTDLTLTPVYDADGAVTTLLMRRTTETDDVLPNFRQGDMVMLYERNSATDTAVNKQIFRCIIEEMMPDSLKLHLAFRQRNARIFRSDSLYAIEPGYSDGPFTQAYRGLVALLKAPPRRKALILGQRKADSDTSRPLTGRYANADIDRIVLKAKQAEDLFLLIGPPGTGKTSVALRSIVCELRADAPDNNLLLMAYTNRAVDEICEMLESLSPVPDYIRIGQELSCAERFRHRLLPNVIGSAGNRKEIYERLAPVHLFVGTISSLTGTAAELFALKRFDTALVDEASQVLEPQLLPLLCAVSPLPTADKHAEPCAIRRFILIGDHKQLPAVVLQSSSESQVRDKSLNAIGLTDCADSLFERFHRLQVQQGNTHTVDMLHRQGRMHPTLCGFVNRVYYNNCLDIIPLPHQIQPLEFRSYLPDAWSAFVATTRLGLVDVRPARYGNNPKVNEWEAQAVARLIDTLHALFRQNNLPGTLARSIGVIVPFRGQISMIRSCLASLSIPDHEDIVIDTVERYQGSQRDIIIFSSTISRPYQTDTLSAPVYMDGAWTDRKLNVALTRARKQFFLVGNASLLRRSPSYNSLLDYISQHGQTLKD